MEIELKLTLYPGDVPAVLRAVGDVASVVEPPAVKVTVPVGSAGSPLMSLTVADRVTTWPAVAGFGVLLAEMDTSPRTFDTAETVTDTGAEVCAAKLPWPR